MRLLVLKLGLFIMVCLAILTFVLVNYGGKVDFFYEKFTSPKAKSMIIGDSRSLQGIQPRVINDYFEKQGYDLPVLNYSFTIAQAIIGPLYNNSIFKKLDETSDNGIFIISITPEMITSRKGYDNIRGEFREAGQPPHNINFVAMNPNYEYFVKNLSFFHFKGMFGNGAMLHKDGWLEENNLTDDEKILEEWKKNQLNVFLRDRDDFIISDIRVKSLNILVQKLKKRGHVSLVRMPISKEFFEYEEEYYPEFNQIINSIAESNHIPYFDFNKKSVAYKTYDGHHIDKYSGKVFTKNLCDSIHKSLVVKK